MAIKKNKFLLWKKITFSIISLSIVFAVIWSAFWWSDFQNTLTIQKVIFSDTAVLDKKNYELCLGNIIGIHPDKISLNAISNLIEEHPYVKAARVSNHYPGVIKIEIMERKPIALLQASPMIMLDGEGVVLPDLNNFADFNLPTLSNFNSDPDLYPLGKKALSVKVKESIVWLARLQKDYESLYNNLSEMKMTSVNEMELILADEPTQIFLGNDDVWSRIEILQNFEKRLTPKKISDYSYLDMRYKNQIIVKGRRS
tara:strand:+ start:867 stop:1634 length:768 start_codon:yes stop_codon:yes gene_type:complete